MGGVGLDGGGRLGEKSLMPKRKELATWDGGYVTASGVYVIRRSIAGKRYEVSTRCTVASAAYKHLVRFETDPDGYTPRSTPARDTLYLTEELAQEYLDWCRLKKGNRSRRWAEHQVRFLTWWGEKLLGKDLRRLDIDTVRAFLSGASSEGHKAAVLKGLFSWLRKHRTPQLISPAQDVVQFGLAIPKTKKAQLKRSRVVPASTIEALTFSILGVTPPALPERYKCALLVQAGTGWHVEATQRFSVAGRVYEEGERLILVSPEEKDGEPIAREVSSRVFAAGIRLLELGGFVGYFGYWKAIKKACRQLHLTPFGPGSFRHTVATYAVKAGATMEQVALAHRHKDKRTTDRYIAMLTVPPKIPTPM